MNALYSAGERVAPARVIREYRAAIVPLVVVLVINLAVLLLAVLPLSQRVAGNEQRAIAAERAAAVANAELNRARALGAGKAKATEDLETFYTQVLPANVASARRILQLRLQQQAREHGVQYESGGTDEEVIRDSPLMRLSTEMRLSGDYAAIRAFIYELETSPAFLVVENVALTEGTEQGAPLAVSLNVSTYYRAPTAAPVPGRSE